MNEFKDFAQSIIDFFKNIIMSIYNFLNHYLSEQVLIMLGIALLAFIICVIFKKISER